MTNRVQDILHSQYYLEYDLDETTSCWEYGCNDEGICRCSTIESWNITDVDLNSIYKDVCQAVKVKLPKGKEPPTFGNYLVDRILSYYEIYNPDLWDLSIGGGYYGQEVYNAFHSNESETIKTLNAALVKLEASNRSLIEFLLTLEYGYVLGSLENRKYSIQKLATKDVHLPNDAYLHKPKDSYKPVSEIYGLVRYDNGQYHLVDGYHRWGYIQHSGINEAFFIEAN